MDHRDRKVLRLIGRLQRAERANQATAETLLGMACGVEARGNMDYGASLRLLAEAFLAVDREHTKATIKAIRQFQEAEGL